MRSVLILPYGTASGQPALLAHRHIEALLPPEAQLYDFTEAVGYFHFGDCVEQVGLVTVEFVLRNLA